MHLWEVTLLVHDYNLPEDLTGQLDSIREFIEDKLDICKWVGIVIIVIQVRCLSDLILKM